MGRRNVVSLKDYFDALRDADQRVRDADQRAIEIARDWTKERLESHNGLIAKMDNDRSLFASKDTVNALKEAFDIYKEITAKALALAEGKSKGYDTVRTAVSFAIGLGVAGVGMWAALKGVPH